MHDIDRLSLSLTFCVSNRTDNYQLLRISTTRKFAYQKEDIVYRLNSEMNREVALQYDT